jgi:hypothetical protein
MNKAILLFSGGIDSSYTAVKSAGKYDKLILITYRTPGMINLHLARKTARNLKKSLKGNIEHRTIDIRDFILEIRGGFFKCLKACCKYHFLYTWCLGCKLGMHLYTINLCREEGIKTVMDGSSIHDAHALEQKKECEDFFNNLYAEHGIDFFSPFYDETTIAPPNSAYLRLLSKTGLFKAPTAARAAYLKKTGIHTGPAFISQHRTMQPSCVKSLAFNFPRVFLKMIYKEKKECYLGYLKETLAAYNTKFKK